MTSIFFWIIWSPCEALSVFRFINLVQFLRDRFQNASRFPFMQPLNLTYRTTSRFPHSSMRVKSNTFATTATDGVNLLDGSIPTSIHVSVATAGRYILVRGSLTSTVVHPIMMNPNTIHDRPHWCFIISDSPSNKIKALIVVSMRERRPLRRLPCHSRTAVFKRTLAHLMTVRPHQTPRTRFAREDRVLMFWSIANNSHETTIILHTVSSNMMCSWRTNSFETTIHTFSSNSNDIKTGQNTAPWFRRVLSLADSWLSIIFFDSGMKMVIL